MSFNLRTCVEKAKEDLFLLTRVYDLAYDREHYIWSKIQETKDTDTVQYSLFMRGVVLPIFKCVLRGDEVLGRYKRIPERQKEYFYALMFIKRYIKKEIVPTQLTQWLCDVSMRVIESDGTSHLNTDKVERRFRLEFYKGRFYVVFKCKWNKIALDMKAMNLARRFLEKAEKYVKTGRDKEKLDAWVKRINRGKKK